jgi:hypothetical protein
MFSLRSESLDILAELSLSRFGHLLEDPLRVTSEPDHVATVLDRRTRVEHLSVTADRKRDPVVKKETRPRAECCLTAYGESTYVPGVPRGTAVFTRDLVEPYREGTDFGGALGQKDGLGKEQAPRFRGKPEVSWPLRRVWLLGRENRTGSTGLQHEAGG